MDAEDIIEGDATALHEESPGNQPAWDDMPPQYKENLRLQARSRYTPLGPDGPVVPV